MSEADETPRKLARKVSQLRDRVFDAVRRREHVQQPLFWMILHTELKELRKAKAERRAIETLLED